VAKAQGGPDTAAQPTPAAPAAPAAPATQAAQTAAPAAPIGEEPSSESSEFGDRTLKGHTFIYPILQEGAFNTTHFGIRQGAAIQTVPQVPLGPLGAFDLSASGLVQDFDLGIKILPWLGVYGTAEGTLITGVNVDSLVLIGGSFGFKGEGGAVVRIVRIERSGTQVAVRLFGGAGTGRDLTVLPLVQGLLSGGKQLGDVLNGSVGKYILLPKGNNTFGGSLHAAQAVGKWVGLQAALEGRSTRDTSSPFDQNANANVDHTTSTTTFKGSFGVDVDGSPSGVPLGAMVEYQLHLDNASPDQGASISTTSHYVAAGLYYTGRRNLLLGIGGATQLNMQPITGVDANNNPAPSGAPSFYYGQFVLRYIW
jgi:hypothetical protein